MTSNLQTSNEPISSDIEQYSNSFKPIQQSNDNLRMQTNDQLIEKLEEENSQLKKSIEIFERKENEYAERIQELEDWNTDFQEKSSSSNLQSQIELLTTRNQQLENDLQRLQSQQRNNQLAFERLDEYEETIAQLQEELDQLRSIKKSTKSFDDQFFQEQKRSESLANLLEQTRLQLQIELKQFEEKFSQIQFDFENEKQLRQSIEKQLIERNEEIQQLRNIQALNMTPGSPPTLTSSSDSQILVLTNQQFHSLYEQFLSLLPNEFLLSDNNSSSQFLIDRFHHLFEQYSSYIGTFSIIQEELDSLKQILNEKQDEIEKLQIHLEYTTDQLTQRHEEQTLENKSKTFDDSDEDELDDILQRAPSQQSLASITPGEKQQLIAQNELLSMLLNEKEQELISIQQEHKIRLEQLKNNIQQIENENESKQIELNDIKHILDEKLRENSSLKKDKMFFIEKISEFERLRQEEQHLIQIPSTTTNINEQNEYTRIFSLYNDLNTKHSQLQIDYQSIQSLIQQKTEAYLSCQNELNRFQNLFYQQKKTSDDIEQLNTILNQRNIQIEQLKSNENDLLNRQIQLEAKLKLVEEQNAKMFVNEKYFQQNQIDLKRLTHERDLAIIEKKQLENRLSQYESVSKLEETNRYLRTNLEQFQLEREKYQEQICTIAHLTNENNEINQRLNQDIQMKNLLIEQLQTEIDSKTKQIIEFNHNIQIANSSRVEKQLVKNILLSYFNTPIDKQQEVLPLLGALVGFTQDEYQKAIEALANNYNNTTGSNWLTSWLGTNSNKLRLSTEAPVYNPDKSFAELLIQYVDQQSRENSQESVLNTGSTSNHSMQFI